MIYMSYHFFANNKHWLFVSLCWLCFFVCSATFITYTCGCRWRDTGRHVLDQERSRSWIG